MPMVEITMDRRFDARAQEVAEQLGADIVAELVAGIEASPDDCQIVISSTARVAVGFPIHVSIKYRAREDRTRERVETTLDAIGRRIRAVFDADVRLRGFPSDNATLAAVNLRAED